MRGENRYILTRQHLKSTTLGWGGDVEWDRGLVCVRVCATVCVCVWCRACDRAEIIECISGFDSWLQARPPARAVSSTFRFRRDVATSLRSELMHVALAWLTLDCCRNKSAARLFAPVAGAHLAVLRGDR